ncbi:MAG TPA: TIGR00730 family Rossman fold protein [Acidobacteriaceae bacterium]|nr:TIGR00730 family Rossman fold protein [Acidobacteriaceae bacterium]
MAEKRKKWIAVFCASMDGAKAEYLATARAMGRAIAERGYGMVYGGATVGAMGAVADGALKAGGAVVGVIPDVIMDLEIGHRGLTELHVVRTMHERKALQAERADAFVALPGGYGTMDEFIEIVTWAKLRIHAKPCVLVNTGGFYDGLLEFLDRCVSEGFLKQQHRDLVLVARDVDEALAIVEREWGARAEVPPHDKRLDELVK